jgi:hypothetical protein
VKTAARLLAVAAAGGLVLAGIAWLMMITSAQQWTP